MADVITIGVLGCAAIARRSVIPAIMGLPDRYTLFGVASRSADSARSAADRFKCTAFTGYQSLIDAPELRAVYIPLPNALHAEWVQKALDRGLHVLVEKSLACEYEDVVRLNDSARRKRLVLIENFQFRFHRQLTYIKDLVDNGTIGELRCLRSSFGIPGLPNASDIRYQKHLGGGALLDTGAYPVKIAQIFLGTDIDVESGMLNSAACRDVDIWGGAFVRQRRGDLFGELAFGFDNHYQCSIELWGSKGKIFTNRIFTAGPDHCVSIDIETDARSERIVLPPDDHFTNMLVHFHRSIRHGERVEDEYVQNINQARIIHEIKRKSGEY
jgi:hypothetical protein